jgi:hypothetical protein
MVRNVFSVEYMGLDDSFNGHVLEDSLRACVLQTGLFSASEGKTYCAATILGKSLHPSLRATENVH